MQPLHPTNNQQYFRKNNGNRSDRAIYLKVFLWRCALCLLNIFAGVNIMTGQTSNVSLHLGSLSLTVASLNICVVFTWFMYSRLYGRATLSDVYYKLICRMARYMKKKTTIVTKAADNR